MTECVVRGGGESPGEIEDLAEDEFSRVVLFASLSTVPLAPFPHLLLKLLLGREFAELVRMENCLI